MINDAFLCIFSMGHFPFKTGFNRSRSKLLGGCTKLFQRHGCYVHTQTNQFLTTWPTVI